MTDETTAQPAASTETPPTAVQPAPVAPAAVPAAQAPLEADVKASQLEGTIAFLRERPAASAKLAGELGYVSADQYKRDRINDAIQAAVANGLPPELTKFLAGETPAEIHARAAELKERLAAPAPTAGTAATAPTALPATPAAATVPPVYTDDYPAGKKLTKDEALAEYKKQFNAAPSDG